MREYKIYSQSGSQTEKDVNKEETSAEQEHTSVEKKAEVLGMVHSMAEQETGIEMTVGPRGPTKNK